MHSLAPNAPSARRPHTSNSSDDQERERFLKSEEQESDNDDNDDDVLHEKGSDTGSDSDDEEKRRNPIMANRTAQLSSPDVLGLHGQSPSLHRDGHPGASGGTEEDDGWGSELDDYVADENTRRNTGLSSKAGIILVRPIL